MSEYINNSTKHRDNIYNFCKGMVNKENGIMLIEKYKKDIDIVVPRDVLFAFDKLVLENINMEQLKTGVNKILNLFYTSLNEFSGTIEPEDNTFLSCLKKENEELEKRLNEIKPGIKKINKKISDEDFKKELILLKEKFIELLEFDKHYIKKENILFPILEKEWGDYRCLQIMWSFHDDIRRNLKSVISQLQNTKVDLFQINRLIGDLFFDMHAIKFREEKILFTPILESISNDVLEDMYQQSFELGFAFIETPPKRDISETKEKTIKSMTIDDNQNFDNIKDIKLDMGTGQLSLEQILLMLNSLPVDITFVDENDKVRYFSNPSDRFFPRSKAIIGRLVENCHPPESVHIVKKIVNAFRTGEKNNAKFWIHIKDKFVLIQYFALRDNNGNYKGVIEASQEVTDIRNLKGERRLLEWD